MLEKKWPEKYNEFGQVTWLGGIYGKGVLRDFSSVGGRVYFGVWGTAPFQSLYQSSNSLWSLTLAPEWYLATGFLALIFLLRSEERRVGKCSYPQSRRYRLRSRR